MFFKCSEKNGLVHGLVRSITKIVLLSPRSLPILLFSSYSVRCVSCRLKNFLIFHRNHMYNLQGQLPRWVQSWWPRLISVSCLYFKICSSRLFLLCSCWLPDKKQILEIKKVKLAQHLYALGGFFFLHHTCLLSLPQRGAGTASWQQSAQAVKLWTKSSQPQATCCHQVQREGNLPDWPCSHVLSVVPCCRVGSAKMQVYLT